jgi:hypothetical protein
LPYPDIVAHPFKNMFFMNYEKNAKIHIIQWKKQDTELHMWDISVSMKGCGMCSYAHLCLSRNDRTGSVTNELHQLPQKNQQLGGRDRREIVL